MANSSKSKPVFSGETALPNQPASKSANPAGGSVGLIFHSMEHLGKLNIRGDQSLKASVKAATGCNFPPLANHFETAGERRVVWLAPDEYLLLCESGKEKALHDTLTSTIKTIHFAITDVSDSLCALWLSGPAVRDVLAKGCSLDLHPSKFGTGKCAQSLLAHAGITLMAISDDAFILICRTSFAPYVHDWLVDAALEYGYHFTP
ncbi:MAG: sarcosine oxidase subunit gamma [Candidatus Puniceispirillaceae bacterium]